MTRSILAIVATLLIGTTAFADTIAIIGTGDVGGALGPAFAQQGNTIVYGSREPQRREVAELVERTGPGASAKTPAEAAAAATIVVLAVPGLLVEEITRGLGDLSGKIIIDPTNPLKREADHLEHAVSTSNTEIIQAAAPGAKVVKAFNTLSWSTMVDPSSAGGPVSIPLAGNDLQAKHKVAELVQGMGLEPIDVGPAENAHWVEGMLMLWINNRYGSARPSFDYYLRRS